MADGDNLREVLIPPEVFGQQDEVIVAAVLVVLEPMVVVPGDIHLTADDGFHPGIFLSTLEKLLYPVHIAVIRDGKGGHTQLLGPPEKVFYGRLPIQDRILGMDVKMNETHKNKDSKKA
jgi:hypothetical protein